MRHEEHIRPEPVLLSWSGGKDSALALARLRTDARLVVTGLLTTVTTGYDRISIHGVRRTLLHRQAEALRLPVHEIEVAPQSSNEAYEAAWRACLEKLAAPGSGVSRLAFGDIFLEDVRQYREDMAAASGFEAMFPLWGVETRLLAAEVLASGFAARVVCVDTQGLDASYAGRVYDSAFLDALPAAVDPCGERGEFHTFVSAGPGFHAPVEYTIGETVLRDDRFAYCDLVPGPS